MDKVNVSNCKFIVDIVPYMYGELAASELSAFESHLPECCECTDEFAMISNVRYEVYDWKKTEFDPLPTPYFEIPRREVEPATASVGWFDKLRAAFASSWAVPGTAFAGLTLVMIVALQFFSGDNGPNVAQVNSNTPPASVPSLVEPEPPKPVVSEQVEDERRSAPAPLRATTPKREVEAKAVRNVKTVVPKRLEATAIRQPISQPNQTAPRLNEFSEDEDTSLRLAQIFEDIDTRD